MEGIGMKFLGKIENSHDQFTNIRYIGLVEDRGFIIVCSYSKFEDSYYSFAILNTIHQDSEVEIYEDCNDFIEAVDGSKLIGEMDIPFTYDLSKFVDNNHDQLHKLLDILKETSKSKHISHFEYNRHNEEVVVDIKHVHIVCFLINNKEKVYVYSNSDADRDSNKVILSLYGFDYIEDL